jgi:hypothetical protein
MLVVFTGAQAAEIIAVTPSPYNPTPTSQIIMKDGNICSPRLGCW